MMEWTEQRIEAPDAPPGTRTLRAAAEDGGELVAVLIVNQGQRLLQVAYKPGDGCALCGNPEERHPEPLTPGCREYMRPWARWPTIEEIWGALDRLTPKGCVMFAALVSQMDHPPDPGVRIFQLQEAQVAPPRMPKGGRRIDG